MDSTLFIFLLLSAASSSLALRFIADSETYAKYPKWNACVNASITFEFRTRQKDGLLMYTDDSGRYDYLQVGLEDGAVKLWMTFVKDTARTVVIELGSDLNDGRWHTVKVKRNQRETTLLVDDNQSSKIGFDANNHFGDNTSSPVYFGGVPSNLVSNLQNLNIPETVYNSKLAGEMRNIIYNNCSCLAVRASMIEGRGTRDNYEACDIRNDCTQDCLCISTDRGSSCRCDYKKECIHDILANYHLPMDSVLLNAIQNPSGLGAVTNGGPRLVKGVRNMALALEGKDQWIKVAGAGHKGECFGNLDHCDTGYYIGMWVKFEETSDTKTVYMSNGGHRRTGHGIALTFGVDGLEFVFKNKEGDTWVVRDEKMVEGIWYHVAASWDENEGLYLYVNGRQADHNRSSRKTTAADVNDPYQDFVIGRSNDGSGLANVGKLTVDEFLFQSNFKNEKQAMAAGAAPTYHIFMDTLTRDKLDMVGGEAKIVGGGQLIPGKIGKALSLSGRGEHVDLGDTQGRCLGDLQFCPNGFYISFFIRFPRIDNNMRYIFSSPQGVNIYQRSSYLIATAQRGRKNWEVRYPRLVAGRWYFIQVSWSPDSGLTLYVDHEQVARLSQESTSRAFTPSVEKRAFLGRGNSGARRDFARAVIDDVDIAYAGHEMLQNMGFLMKDRPQHYHFDFEKAEGQRLVHDKMLINLNSNPKLVEGKIGNALQLDGTQFVDFADQSSHCFGNLDLCQHGVLFAFWLRLDMLKDNMYFLSSGDNGITLKYSDRRLKAEARTSFQKWSATSTSDVTMGDWHYVELSFHPMRGLTMFVNNALMAEDKTPAPRAGSVTSSSLRGMYLGRGNVDMRGAEFAEASYDDMDVWFADRTYLTSHGMVQRREPRHFLIKFEELRGEDRLVHPDLSIVLVGRPILLPGKVNNALALRGMGQYADLGRRGEECFSNLLNCPNGITIAAWMKFHRFMNNMVFLSSGENGILMMYRDGDIQISADKRGVISIGGLDLYRWYFFEITWHPDTGLRVYVDNQLVGQSPREHVEAPPTTRGSFFIGKKNHGDVDRATTGIFDIDEMEIWYGKREDLIAFNYIDRDKLGYEAFAFDSATGPRVTHNKYKVTLVNQASIGPGRFDNAVVLDGNGQYVDLGKHFDKCFGNLDFCQHGMTVSLWVNPQDLKEGSTYLSTPTYSLFYEDGLLNTIFQGKERSWTTDSALLRKDEWQRVTLAWHPKKGLTMYINDEVVGRDAVGVKGLPRAAPVSEHVFIGRPLDSDAFTANMLADDLQVWYDDLEQLRATNQYIVQVVPRTITFDTWANNRVLTRDREVRGYGDIRVYRGKGAGTRALYMPGTTSYLDLGSNFTCNGNLDSCQQGATLRMGLRPLDLKDGMVFLDSWPMRVFYRDGRLHAVLQTSDKVWRVDSGELRADRWQRVELTWHPRQGLIMFIDGRRVGQVTYPESQQSQVPDDWRTYFGRALEGGRTYANTVVDNIEFWQAYRDFLPADEYLKIPSQPDPIPTPRPRTTRRPVYPPRFTDFDNTNEISIVGAFVTAKPQQPQTQRPRPRDTNERDPNRVTAIIFEGKQYVQFQLGRLPSYFFDKMDRGEFQFYFTSRKPNGLLWFHEHARRRMYLAMKDGNLVFVSDDGANTRANVITVGRRQGVRFDDGLWHAFKIVRTGRKVVLTVDGRYPEEYTFPRDIQFLSPADISLGGVRVPVTIDGQRIPIFEGGMAQIVYRTEMQRPGQPKTENEVNLIAEIGKGPDPKVPITDVTIIINKGTTTPIPTTRKPILTAITLKDKGLHIQTTGPFRARDGSSISLKFRTVHKNGLLLYSTSRLYGKNFFALEIYDGKLYYIYNFGGKTHRELISQAEVADGQQHEVKLQFKKYNTNVVLDGVTSVMNYEGREQLPTALGNLFVGGYSNYQNMPWHTWAREGYQGCLEDIQISGRIIDLHSYVRNHGFVDGVEMQCVDMPKQCSVGTPCGAGRCTNLWNGIRCDCRGTDFTGNRCELPAWTGLFNGKTSYKMSFSPQQRYHVNDISLRFMAMSEDGLLFQTRARNDGLFMRAELKDGRVLVTTNLGGEQKVLTLGENLNDWRWHTLNIRRRGNQLDAWVDSEDTMIRDILKGSDYYLKLDDLFVGGDFNELNLQDSIPNLTGYLRNFYIGGVDILTELEKRGPGTFYRFPDIPNIIMYPSTIVTNEDYITLAPMGTATNMNIHFLFKTHDHNGVILLNKGLNNELFVVELVNKRLHFMLDVPNKIPLTSSPSSKDLNDGEWHSVSISHDGKQFNWVIDGVVSSSSSNGINNINLKGNLYVGGIPAEMFKDQRVQRVVQSKTGFRGCLASFDLGHSRGMQNLFEVGKSQNVRVLNICNAVNTRCTEYTCKNNGICHDHLNNGTTWCDCSMTGWAGEFCDEEPLGYYFGRKGIRNQTGLLVYEFPTNDYKDYHRDEIVVGVMTNQKDGVVAKLISDVFKDFIQIKLVNGYAQVEYATNNDGSSTTISNSKHLVSDGNYHIIRFVRTANNGTLFVDGAMTNIEHINSHGKFDQLSKVFVGGVLYGGNQIATGTGMRGIVGGLNVNGEMIFPIAKAGIRTGFYEDVVVAPHPFTLTPLQPIPVVTTAKPVVPPVAPVDPVGPGGDTGGQVSQIAAVASPPTFGPRAGAVMGTILGLMLLASSLMWAFYKCKPGMCPCCAGGGGKAGSGMAISSPRAASNMGAVQAATAAGAGAGSGAGAGAGAGAGSAGTALASADGIATDVVDAPDGRFGTGGGTMQRTLNGGTSISTLNTTTNNLHGSGFAGGSIVGSGVGTLVGGGGGGSLAPSSYYYSQHLTASTNSLNQPRGDGYDSATLRALGTFSNKGTAIGTPKPARAAFGSTASASGYSMSEANQSYHFEGNSTADYDVATGVHGNANYQSNTLSAGGGGGFSSATMSSNYNYTVKTIKTSGGMYGGSQSNIIVTPGAMGEEVRVDCCLMTTDGHSVVTGSSLGPPQVWNMSSGELMRIMQGETVGSTFLHLVNGDRLLVGAINSDLEVNQYSVPKGVHHYIFQIWDFASGNPLQMAEHETVSALSVMSDNDKVAFARSDKFGGGTNLVVWDLLGNQAVKEMRYDAPIGSNDYVSFLAISQNDRYAVTGFTNTFDNFAEFVIFDLRQSSYNVNDPNILRLDAVPECTAMLPREEAVTGLRNGDLVVWSLVTGQPSRQLLASNGKHAHNREVKAVARSKDSRYLVSASADGTLKLWDLETERQLTTMSGHHDEVWCCAISEDNEIVVSGSRDGTIRLWKLRSGQEIASFNAGVDVFYITMSKDKGTIVALGDKFGARKLVMLQVVRSKVKRQVLA